MRRSRARQALFDAAIKVARENAAGVLAFELLMRLVQRGSRAGEVAIEYNLDGHSLLIPADHDLPRFRRYSPSYGANLGRVAGIVHGKYAEMSAVDVGANVGDSALQLRRGAPVPVLCVEGDPRFAALLRLNLADEPEVEVAEAFVGPVEGEQILEARSEGGTTRLEPGARGRPVPLVRLASLLAERPRFARPRLVKLDTDGFDCPIIEGESELLADLRPVVFFEYAPDLYADPRDALRVFDALAAAGYRCAVCYLNHGEYLAAPTLEEPQLLEDLHHHVTGHSTPKARNPRYLDIAAFHADDEDLWAATRRAERGWE